MLRRLEQSTLMKRRSGNNSPEDTLAGLLTSISYIRNNRRQGSATAFPIGGGARGVWMDLNAYLRRRGDVGTLQKFRPGATGNNAVPRGRGVDADISRKRRSG